MKNKLIIYGTVFGVSVYDLAQNYCNWDVIGFFDDTLPIGTTIINDLVTLDPEKVFSLKENINVVVAVSKPSLKEKLINNLVSKYDNINFPTLISPNALVSKNAIIGSGCIISHIAIVSTGCVIADYTLVDVRATVGHGTQIGKYSTISASSHISGNILMGEKCFCGAMSFVMEKKKIGDDVVIAAGSMVFTNIPANVTVMGNPATILMKHK